MMRSCICSHCQATTNIFCLVCNVCGSPIASDSKRELKRFAEKRLERLRDRAKAKRLLYRFTINELLSTMGLFENACALTGVSRNLTFDHFIPLDTGHGGTYIGNVYPLCWSLNYDKGNRNPFEWIETIHHRRIQSQWRKLVAMLATLNGLTVPEFALYVTWCCNNRRSSRMIAADGFRSSLHLWRLKGLTVKNLTYYTRRKDKAFFRVTVCKGNSVSQGRIAYTHSVGWGHYEAKGGLVEINQEELEGIILFIRYSDEYQKAMERIRDYDCRRRSL